MAKERFYKLEPEVAGMWGENTIADTSTHPPVITRLHYRFDGWLGDCLLESFPCFIITEAVAEQFARTALTGYCLDAVEISFSEKFHELGSTPPREQWRWLKPIGQPGLDDLGVDHEFILTVSERTLKVFSVNGLKNCDIVEVDS